MNYIVSKLLRDLLDDLLYQSTPISTMLRKLKVIAALLKNKDLEAWVTKELEGYAVTDHLPPYRVLEVESIGLFDESNEQGYESPLKYQMDLPEDLAHYAETAEIYRSISIIEAMMEEDPKEMRIYWPDNKLSLLVNHCKGDKPCLEAWKHVGKSMYAAMISTLKNNLLDALITIINTYPEVLENDEMLSSEKRKKIGKILYKAMCC